ncbi:TKL family protein kinase [Trichomonas vaginalis G3]|uniref:TKL family protein kinase n=1 Tax=Trichomonas vaginalis (strain ATCC PRA-98 / G3) TaxID=412133 RepID=A2DQD6_TRIV3|nr:protein kinase protein [Trichomonas vaginalis G3]EAY17393.1 TKL family protein kinase [Trichomonas vaginalis G3]KAI5491404.1 protein kinase protein [Trichomonas vaginalis G3]|eukprot:XP_001330762.1 TKL family protein kinase [Trichomonas vaginalis G3]
MSACNKLGVEKAIEIKQEQLNINKKSDLSKIRKKLNQILKELGNSDQNLALKNQIQNQIQKITEIEGQKSNFEALIQNSYEDINLNESDLDYTLNPNDNHLGAGGFGTVSKATLKRTSEFVAVKKIRYDKLSPKAWQSIWDEITLMKKLHHPCILELVGAQIHEPYCIITRFCSGRSLFDRLHRQKTNQLPALQPTELTKIAYQIALGMEYLHAQKIVHRDLKTLNILLDDKNNAVIADFGLSGHVENQMNESVGTPHYSAPEMLVHTAYTSKVDVYSYAIVVWEMLTGEVPFNDKVLDKIYEHVVTFGWRLPIPDSASPGLVKLITTCWSKDPTERPEFHQIVKQFEDGLIKFPDSDDLDYTMIKKEIRCPPINENYAIDVLKHVTNTYFGSVLKFIAQHIDAHVVEIMRNVNILDDIVQCRSENFDSVLLLASNILDQTTDWIRFLESGATKMLRYTIESNEYLKYGTLWFLVRMPNGVLSNYIDLLPKIISLLQKDPPKDIKEDEIKNHRLCIFRVIFRFEYEQLQEYKEIIGHKLPTVVDYVVKHTDNLEAPKNFQTLITLFSYVSSNIDRSDISKFYPLLSYVDDKMQKTFISDLDSLSDESNYPLLILSMLKAHPKAGSHNLVDFLFKCKGETISQLWKIDGFFKILEEKLKSSDRVTPPLAVMFCIAQIPEAALEMADHEDLMTALFEIKDHDEQQLQILTALTANEEFCKKKDLYMDSTIHLLARDLMDDKYRDCSVRLISAMSSHQTGCKKLEENTVFLPFVQYFCSSSIPDSLSPNTIIKNAVKARVRLQQPSVIVSCLMQKMVNELSRKEEILDTLTVLVTYMEGSVQIHDIKTIIIPQINSDDPKIVYHSLKFIKHCNFAKFQPDMTNELVSAINDMLNNKDMMYPSIIEVAADVLNNVHSLDEQYAKSIFDRMDLINFLKKTVDKFPVKYDAKKQKILEYVKKFEQKSAFTNTVFLKSEMKFPFSV